MSETGGKANGHPMNGVPGETSSQQLARGLQMRRRTPAFRRWRAFGKTFVSAIGKWFADEKEDAGIQTMKESKFY